MRVIAFFTALFCAAITLSAPAAAQGSLCQVIYGQAWTVAQWNSCFNSKQATLGYTPVNKAGDQMQGELFLFDSAAAGAGTNIGVGAAPTTPQNGDVWETSNGIFGYVNGKVYSLTGGSSSPAYVLPVTDPQFGAVCNVTERQLVSGSSTTAGSNTITLPGGTSPLVGETLVIPGYGHVTGASDLFVFSQNSTISSGGSGWSSGDVGQTITVMGGTVVTITQVTGSAVSGFFVSTYAGYTATATTLSQTSTTGGGTGFVLAPKWNGSTYYGAVATVVGSSIGVTPATNVNMAITASPITDLWYGNDDETGGTGAIPAAFTAAQAQGISQVAIMATSSSYNGCGIASTVQLPATKQGTASQAWLVGTGLGNSCLYALAPMTDMVQRSGSPSGGYGGGMSGMCLRGGGLVTNALIQVDGTRDFTIYKNFFDGATNIAGGGVSSIDIGSTQNAPEVFIDGNKIITNDSVYSAAYYPDYQIYFAANAPDGYANENVIDNAGKAHIYIGAPNDHIADDHLYQYPNPDGNINIRGVDVEGATAEMRGIHFDNALGTTDGIFINNSQAMLLGTDFSCNGYSPPSGTTIGIHLAAGVTNNTLSAVTQKANCNLTGATIASQDTSWAASNQACGFTLEPAVAVCGVFGYVSGQVSPTGGYGMGSGNHLLASPSAPTIGSGFCSSPTVPKNNGSAAFTINVGTSCSGSTGVIDLPTASNGWACQASDQSNPGPNDPKQSAQSSSSVTLTNYAATTGLAAAWTTNDTLLVNCLAY